MHSSKVDDLSTQPISLVSKAIVSTMEEATKAKLSRHWHSFNLFIVILFIEIAVNSGRIFTDLQSGKVNILPLLRETEKNNLF